MDPLEALRQIAQQLNDLSGGMLDILNQLGGAQGGGAPSEEGAVPAPPSGE